MLWNNKPAVSIIIPTHNRGKSVLKLLDCLQLQTYPLELIEVIVVVDGGNDETIEILTTYKAPYTFRFFHQQQQGAAVARNHGAANATGDMLIFLDDDIEPSNEFVEAHAKKMTDPYCVVIGYLPYKLPANPGFYQKSLWTWWEDKFYKMSKPGYRYNFEDLLSGNFSVSNFLFNKISGFNSTFKCTEDYELGLRLIENNANFVYAKKAWGYHNDVVTNLKRSLRRKRQEANSHVLFCRLHPTVVKKFRLYNILSSSGKTTLKSLLFFLAFKASKVGDLIADSLEHLMNFYESLKMRKSWEQLNNDLHNYWYLRGLIDQLHNKKNIRQFRSEMSKLEELQPEIILDLSKGLSIAEEQLNVKRPHNAVLLYGSYTIGKIVEPGSERLHARHLNYYLATQFSQNAMKAMALDGEFLKQEIQHFK